MRDTPGLPMFGAPSGDGAASADEPGRPAIPIATLGSIGSCDCGLPIEVLQNVFSPELRSIADSAV
jgi:hypothetical protein